MNAIYTNIGILYKQKETENEKYKQTKNIAIINRRYHNINITFILRIIYRTIHFFCLIVVYPTVHPLCDYYDLCREKANVYM